MTWAATRITAEEMAAYRATAQRRQMMEEQAIAERRDLAWQVARESAELLKAQYGATQVAVFGSLARGELFLHCSDVDLAVWGMDDGLYFRAVSHLLSLSPGIEVDLVMVEKATESLKAAINAEGVHL